MWLARFAFYVVAVVAGILVVLLLVREGYVASWFNTADQVAGIEDDLSGDAADRNKEYLEGRVLSSVEDRVREKVDAAFGGSDQEFSFDVLGDIEPDYSTYDTLLKRIREDGARFLVVNGDVSAKGTVEQFEEYQRHTEERLDVPYYTTPGNHDILGDGDASTFASVFGYRYKSFDYQNAHFVLLDNSSAARGFDDEQLEWLRADLLENDLPFVFVFMHRPLNVPFANVVLGKENELSEENVSVMIDLLSEHHVSAVFASHIPGYIAYEFEGSEIPVYATGGGGTPSSLGFLEDDFHYLHVDVNAHRFRVEKVDP